MGGRVVDDRPSAASINLKSACSREGLLLADSPHAPWLRSSGMCCSRQRAPRPEVD